MRVRSGAMSHRGQVRPHNEDAYVRDDEHGLYVVADGVGGRAKGEVASQQAVEEVDMWVRRHLDEIERGLGEKPEGGSPEVRRIIEAGIQQACYMLFGLAEQDPSKKGMSTTLSMLLIRADMAVVASVGDSRVYRLRDDELVQLTEDHTLWNFKKKQGTLRPEDMGKGKNIITRAVGYKEYVQVDVWQLPIEVDDRYLLCSDGLHGYVQDPHELRDVMLMEPSEGVEHAVNLANDRGGRDNITTLLIAIEA